MFGEQFLQSVNQDKRKSASFVAQSGLTSLIQADDRNEERKGNESAVDNLNFPISIKDLR